MKFAPSILSMDFSKFNEQIKIINDNFEYIHFDIMDGHFVPNITFGQDILKMFNNNSDLFLDVHLMISDPMKFANDFINAGADGITFHVESFDYDLNRCNEFIDYLHAKNIKVGVSIKPNTGIEIIETLLSKIDLVLIMSVEPGFGGQKFIEDSLEKVIKLKDYRIKNNLSFIIEIDGGINYEVAKECKEAGVDIAVAGSYVFNGDIVKNISEIKTI